MKKNEIGPRSVNAAIIGKDGKPLVYQSEVTSHVISVSGPELEIASHKREFGTFVNGKKIRSEVSEVTTSGQTPTAVQPPKINVPKGTVPLPPPPPPKRNPKRNEPAQKGSHQDSYKPSVLDMNYPSGPLLGKLVSQCFGQLCGTTMLSNHNQVLHSSTNASSSSSTFFFLPRFLGRCSGINSFSSPFS